MKAYEFSTNITPDGKLELPKHLKNLPHGPKVRVIVLVEELSDTEETDGEAEAFSTESFRTSWQQAITGQTLPLTQLWEGIDVD